MIDFQQLSLQDKQKYDQMLLHCGERGCEYSFANLYLWGNQQTAFLGESLVFFSQFDRGCFYPFPLIKGNPKEVLDALVEDARGRGISCRLSTMTREDCELLESLYPGQFSFHDSRDFYDYVYAIDDLADLKGRSYQKKRTHLNKFRTNHPDCQALELTEALLPMAEKMAMAWLDQKLPDNPDLYSEQKALEQSFRHYRELGFEGLVLMENDTILAMTMGTRLSEESFDVHFEKALDGIDGAYAAVNQAFARHLRDKHPELRWLNREDDLGLPGLRQAKRSYYPHHMIEKSWAQQEDPHAI